MKPTHHTTSPGKKTTHRDSNTLKQFCYFSLLLFACFATAVAYTTQTWWSYIFIGGLLVFPVCIFGIAQYLRVQPVRVRK